MKKKSLLVLVLMLALGMFSVQTLSYAEDKAMPEVKPGDVKVLIGCDQINMQAVNIGGYNYFKLRDIAKAVNGSAKQFEVTWNDKESRIDLIGKKPYTAVGGELTKAKLNYDSASPSQVVLYANGYKLVLDAYNIDGNNYFKLRDIAGIFNIKLNWDAKSRTILLDPSATGRPT